MCRNANGLPTLMEYESPEDGSEGVPEDAMVEDDACIVHSLSDEVKRSSEFWNASYCDITAMTWTPHTVHSCSTHRRSTFPQHKFFSLWFLQSFGAFVSVDVGGFKRLKGDSKQFYVLNRMQWRKSALPPQQMTWMCSRHWDPLMPVFSSQRKTLEGLI